MPKFSANLTMLFTEYDFLDRFKQASAVGFRAVEYMFPYAYPKEEIVERLAANDLKQTLFNLPAGNWEAGERGIALLPDRVAEFQAGVEQAVTYAKTLRCERVNCLVGLTPKDVPAATARETLVQNLRFAADKLGAAGIKLLIESLNTRDIPGFYLSKTADVLALMDEVGHQNLFYQYDVYHMQVMEGDLTRTIVDNIRRIGHIQIADNPGRHEPGTGEINFGNLFRSIDQVGYQGFIGCEYRPLAKTEDGLGWLRPYL